MILIIPSVVLAQNDQNSIYKILDEAFIKHNKSLNHDNLIEEYKEYISLYPNSIREDEALYRLAELYARNDSPMHQLYTLIKLRYLHNKSVLMALVIDQIDSLITYNVGLSTTDINDFAIKELNHKTGPDLYSQAYIEFLSYIHFLNISTFYSIFIDEINIYKAIYKKKEFNLDAVSYWQAETFKRMGNLESAEIHYLILLNLYRSSEYSALALLELAKINIQKGAKEEAGAYLLELINQFPESTIAGDGQFELAQLYENQFDDVDEAFSNYQMVVIAFPENKNYIPALFKMGNISLLLNDPDAAIESYKTIIERSQRNDELLLAYSNLLKVQLEILEDFEEAAHTHVLIAQSFPKLPKAPSHLLSAAQFYITKTSNLNKSKELLEILVTEYENTPEAVKAKELLNKL